MCIRDRVSTQSTWGSYMRTFGIVLASIVVLSATVTAVSVNSGDFQQLQGNFLVQLQATPAFKALSSSEFGSHLLETITTLLQTGGTFDEVIKLLEELKNNLETEQLADNSDFTTAKASIEGDIKLNREKAAKAVQEYGDATIQVKNLIVAINDLRGKLRNHKKQLKSILDQRKSLEASNAEEQREFAKRNGEQRQVIEVLGTLITDLTNKVLNAQGSLSLVEQKQLFDQIDKIGGHSPISVLVDLTSTFDQNTVRLIIGKLERLREAIKATLAADEANHEKSVATFKAMIEKLQELEDDIRNDEEKSKVQLKSSENAKISETERKATNELLEKQSNTAREASEAQLEVATDNYESRTADRSRSIAIITQVIQLLKASEQEQQQPPAI
eukprot:TRINITY_DN8636_c0_g1_i3.p1 TRINITY_DN8636_c0_g1~~TRINITY_DN8636_c0_g1_i3.p1  ORF type:complete len:388 (-),score=162.09 TRINITY_DN8636_c0_g1_i3:60-1223(-)